MGHPIYQLNYPKGYKTFGIRKKSPFCFPKQITVLVFLHIFFQIFCSKFTFLAYECTFTSANHTIYDIGYLEQTGKKCSIFVKSYFTNFFSRKKKKKKKKNNVQKMELNEKKKKIQSILNRWGKHTHIILVMFTLYVTL